MKGIDKTIAGPSRNRSCHFPFEYKGKKNYGCITDDSQGMPWCATESEYSDDNFGYCDCPDVVDGS